MPGQRQKWRDRAKRAVPAEPGGAAAAPGGAAAAPLPPNWRIDFDPQSNRQFYINTTTGHAQWDPPSVQSAPDPAPVVAMAAMALGGGVAMERTRPVTACFLRVQRPLPEVWEIDSEMYTPNEAWAAATAQLGLLSRPAATKLEQLAFERCRMLSVLWPTDETIDEVKLDILREYELGQTMATRMQECRRIIAERQSQDREEVMRAERQSSSLLNRVGSSIGAMVSSFRRVQEPPACSFEVVSLFGHTIMTVSSDITVHDLTIRIQNETGMDPSYQLLMNDNLEIITYEVYMHLRAFCKTHPVFGRNRIFLIAKNPMFNHQLSNSRTFSYLNTKHYALKLHRWVNHRDIHREVVVLHRPSDIIHRPGRGSDELAVLFSYPASQSLRCLSINQIKMNVADRLRIHPARVVISEMKRGLSDIHDIQCQDVSTMAQIIDIFGDGGIGPLRLFISYQGLPGYVVQNELYGNFFGHRDNPLWGPWGDFPIEDEGGRGAVAHAHEPIVIVPPAPVVPDCDASTIWKALTQSQRNCFIVNRNIVKDPTVDIPGADPNPVRDYTVRMCLELFFPNGIPDEDPCAIVPDDTRENRERVFRLFSDLPDNPLIDDVSFEVMRNPYIVAPSGRTYDKTTLDLMAAEAPPREPPREPTGSLIQGRPVHNQVMQQFLDTFDLDRLQEGGRRRKPIFMRRIKSLKSKNKTQKIKKNYL